MKSKANIVLLTVALLTYWSGLCTASAFYDPGTQRWLNRDPIKEVGGINLSQFVQNDPINHRDLRGLSRDCGKEYNDCMSSCMSQTAPWPYENSDNSPGQNKAGRYRYCEGMCQKAYLECEAENENQKQCPSPAPAPKPAPRLNPSPSFCAQHPAICIGGGVLLVCIVCPECCAVGVIIGAPAGL